MAQRHTVTFEPVDIEIEVSEDETILEGAFRQGIMLAHGCKEGQCSACKSFLIEGEVDLERYSTFALADYEQEEGYTLLCRAHAFSDLVVELLHYDEEMLTSGVPIRALKTKVDTIEPLTHDIYKLSLTLEGEEPLEFHAGQYVDIAIPGSDSSRSFSMSNTPSVADRLEFMIKIYPEGRFSRLLKDELVPGQELHVKGPYGVFILREHSDADLIFIGGGAGMAPIWSLLNSMAERGIERKVTYYYGARTRKDLFHIDQLQYLSDRLSGFRFVPALSEPAPDEDWDGEVGLITDVVDRLEGDLSGREAYLCGPPPMIDASIPMLGAHGIPEARIFYDKFTVTASEEEQERARA
ncbi:MAG: 2Fe-2S iron-sulfur cluster binding domain-containing protein [Solirubrobacterales bacterium]|nr:2Fe-2S iron-sulfur cluster binding domain-containing protein [Solirubrobacterales bacterium]MBV9714440.1 2Fe-2S iron-sulfur cluster binding domain-containing protein [Solirubrobacterales bacterium]